MPAGADPVEAFLAAVSAPLLFLRDAGPQATARTKLPGRVLAERGRRLLAQVKDEEQRRDLEALCVALQEYETATAAEKQHRAGQCFDLLQRLRQPRATEPVVYEFAGAGLEEGLQGLGRPAQFARGVGPRRAEQLRKFGIETIEDLLYHLPFRYEDRRTRKKIGDLRIGEDASVEGEITHLAERYVGRTQRRILEGVLRDETGLLALTWFHQVSYFRSRFQVGERCLVHGRVEGGVTRQKRMVHPEVYSSAEAEAPGILPVYGKPTSISVGNIRKIVQQAVDDHGKRLPSVLPEPVSSAAGVSDLPRAMRALHHPPKEADVYALNEFRSLAHRSVVFDELFYLQLGMSLRRRAVHRETGVALVEKGDLTRRFQERLPFQLTGAQKRVLGEVLGDMARAHPLHRLVQGDVGSGKTVVALYAALVAIENGYQAAFMAPTELLAEQHFATVSGLIGDLGVETALLTSAIKRAPRRELLERVRGGEVNLVVGTHALIQEGVRFKAIGLGVIDEQHRFGVLQRAALRALGNGVEETGQSGLPPDMLLMTATPIPRTLAMTVYGDLDISVLDELPPGRQPVQTRLCHERERAQVYKLVKKELDRGRQGYVVYPLVESSEAVELRDATTMATELKRTVFHGYRVGLLHGKMKSSEKDAVMRRFKAGDLQLLVSTTVIEVGIDVPNATIMVIEHAERFGLAQLHQLRGRVGRGADAARCVLLSPFVAGDDAHTRLRALAASNDGFRIAEADLELRGPGELLGTRQSGLPDFRVANLIRDRRILEDARQAADAWLEHDPPLARPESQPLRRVLAHRWAGRLELAEIG
jgi:ATP-dependent DNA helicase RecG